MLQKFTLAPFTWGNGYVKRSPKRTRRTERRKAKVAIKTKPDYTDGGCHDCMLCPHKEECTLKD